MNDRREFLDRLRTDLAAGVPGFRGRQRRRRIVASAVAGVALLGGLGAFVAFGDDGPSDSVSAVGDVPDAPGADAPSEEPVLRTEVVTGTVRDLTDTAADIEDAGTRPLGTPLGGPLDLVDNGRAPGGTIQACPLTASSQSGIGDFFGERGEWVESDDVVEFIAGHIRATYPPGAPIRTSALYEPLDPGLAGSSRVVLAPWAGDDQSQIGAWFSLIKTAEFGLAIASDWGCTPFLWETGASNGGFAPTGEVGGYSRLSCGEIDYNPWTDPQQLADASDLVVIGTVRSVYEGRSYMYEDINIIAFGGVTLELGNTTDLSGTPVPGPVYVEVEVCGPIGSTDSGGISIGALRAEEVATIIPPNSPAVWFLVETREWTPEEVPQPLNPLAGRASADIPLYTPRAAGVWYENKVGRVGASNTESPADLLPSFSAFVDLEADQLVAELQRALNR